MKAILTPVGSKDLFCHFSPRLTKFHFANVYASMKILKKKKKKCATALKVLLF